MRNAELKNESDLGVRGVFISLSFFFLRLTLSLLSPSASLSFHCSRQSGSGKTSDYINKSVCLKSHNCISSYFSVAKLTFNYCKTRPEARGKNNKCRYFPKHKQLQSQSRRATPFGEPLHWYWLGCCRCIGAATLFDFYVIYLFYRTLKFLIIFATSVNRVF